eukprot:3331977-Rhodomonas_salina.1
MSAWVSYIDFAQQDHHSEEAVLGMRGWLTRCHLRRRIDLRCLESSCPECLASLQTRDGQLNEKSLDTWTNMGWVQQHSSSAQKCDVVTDSRY